MNEQFSSTQPTEINASQTNPKPVRLGLISTAFGVESTQSEFYFWADRGSVLESGQIVYARQTLPQNNNLGIAAMTVYGVIEKVIRLSSSRSIEADMRERDGDAGQQRLWPRGGGTERTGTTYAYCRVIGIEPNILTPLHEDTEVFLAGEQEAGQGYGYPDMLDNYSALPVGLLLNGGITTAGKACLDTRYILGEYGGHINVTGKAGTATKTSFLLNIIKHLMLFAEDTIKRGDELYVVPIVFNAKGSDLMWIGYKNKKFSPDAGDWLAYKQAWGEEYWSRYTTPFNDVQLYSYPVLSGTVRTNLPANTKPYNWSLKDVIEWGTWRYLFSGEDRSQELLMGLMYDIFQQVSKRDNNTMSGFTLNRSKVLHFDGLVEWVNSAVGNDQHYLRVRSHSPLTIEAAVRRFRNTLNSNPVLLKDATTGQPPIFARVGNFGPIIIDIDGLPPGAQRFIVASIIEYLKIDRRNNAGKKQVYVLMLDELNQYAGRNNRDEVAQLFEHVAAQLRSQGIILFGAQQKASDVIEIVFENSATKVLGNTGSGEIGQSIWTRDDTYLVVGVIKSQRARYLSGQPLQILYNLNEGERTPAFLIERRRGQGRRRKGNQVVTYYVRLTSPAIVGPGGGLARIEVSERYLRSQVKNGQRLLDQGNQRLLDAIAADLTQLRTRDLTYARGAVTVEPIRLIERELKLIFRDTQMAAIETMRLLC